MTWVCFSFNGMGSLVFNSTKINTNACKKVLALKKHLLPNIFFWPEKMNFRTGEHQNLQESAYENLV